MTPSEFSDSIPNFGKLSFVEQIKRFAWYLTCRLGKATFTGTDISKCFVDGNLPKPSAVSPFLNSLVNQKKPFLVRKGTAYSLSRLGREQFDKTLSTRDATIAVDKLLSELPAKLHNASERIYLEEALKCFRVCAYRASIVMAWNLAYDHLCALLLVKHLAAFNLQLPKSFPKADVSCIAVRDDLMMLKESQVLQISKSANIISANLHKIMKEKLDRRNIAAHPSGVEISQLTAEDFIRDLVVNVVLAL